TEQPQRLTAYGEQAGEGSLAELLPEVGNLEVGRQYHRALVLITGVDDRVQLLQHPICLVLDSKVVYVEEIDGGKAFQEAHHTAVRLDGAADQVQQSWQRVDRNRASRVDRGLRDE